MRRLASALVLSLSHRSWTWTETLSPTLWSFCVAPTTRAYCNNHSITSLTFKHFNNAIPFLICEHIHKHQSQLEAQLFRAMPWACVEQMFTSSSHDLATNLLPIYLTSHYDFVTQGIKIFWDYSDRFSKSLDIQSREILLIVQPHLNTLIDTRKLSGFLTSSFFYVPKCV